MDIPLPGPSSTYNTALQLIEIERVLSGRDGFVVRPAPTSTSPSAIEELAWTAIASVFCEDLYTFSG